MAESLSCIEIDLTPVFPGAVNVGAKILALELVGQLGKLAPATTIILLTAREAHDELAALERRNVHRRLIVGTNPRFTQVRLWHDRIFRRFPWFVQRAIFELRNFLPLKNYYKAVPYPDLIFYPFGLSYPRRGLPLNAGFAPSVALVHDLQHLTFPQFFSSEELSERQRSLEFHKKHSSIVVMSDFDRNSLIEQMGLPPEAVFTVRPGVLARISKVERHAAERCLRKLRLEQQRYFVYPANFWPHKNHEMLLTAFALARAGELPLDFKLVCPGPPNKRMIELQDAANALGLADSAVFPGFLSAKEFAALMQSSAGLVFPSLYEGYGTTLVEAMAAGCPVACSDHASLREVAGDAALLFDPRRPKLIAEIFCRLAMDEELRSTLIVKGLRQAVRFSDAERMTREYFEIFERVARTNRKTLFVTGVHPDGWVGPIFSIHLPEGSSDRTLSLELYVPGGLPIRRFELMFACRERASPFRAAVQGGRQHLEVPVQAATIRLDVQVRPFFRPCELPRKHASLDSRPLTVMVLKTELRDLTGGTCLI